jgi:hypothetical protein
MIAKRKWHSLRGGSEIWATQLSTVANRPNHSSSLVCVVFVGLLPEDADGVCDVETLTREIP